LPEWPQECLFERGGGASRGVRREKSVCQGNEVVSNNLTGKWMSILLTFTGKEENDDVMKMGFLMHSNCGLSAPEQRRQQVRLRVAFINATQKERSKRMKTLLGAKNRTKSTVSIAAVAIAMFLYLVFFNTNPLYAQKVPKVDANTSIKIFMMIDKIPGASETEPYRNWSEAAGVGFRITNDMESVGGVFTGGAILEGVNILKAISVDSPRLALACARGTHIKTVTVEVAEYSDATYLGKLYTIKMDDVIIRSIAPESNSTHVSLEEAVELYASKITWSTYDVSGVEITECWDFR
jgi:type VI secretion system secreted protein Hcp